MFARLVADSFTRRPRRKLLTTAALALGMAVATAALSVSLDVGDRLAREFRSLGANLLVTPEADSLPLEIGGVDYRPVNSGAYLPETDLGKLKTIFWRNNIIAFAPKLETSVAVSTFLLPIKQLPTIRADRKLIGTWSAQSVALPDAGTFVTGIGKTNPWWRVEGQWFKDDAEECLLGRTLASALPDAVQGIKLKLGDTIYVYADSSADSLSAARPVALRLTGFLDTDGPENDAVVVPLVIVQKLAGKPNQYRSAYVSALTKPDDKFGKTDPETLSPKDFDRWYCTPYVSSIALQVKQALPGSDVRVIRRVADGEGAILTKVRALLWLVTFAALLAAALAVGASSAASVIERRTEIGLMKALGAGSATVGFLLAAEQLLLAFVGGGIGYSLGIFLARLVGEKIFGVAPEPSLLILLVILCLATGVTLLGSAIPLRRASRYEPAPILRGE